MADHDYEELSEKTIDEIKETVKEEDLNLKKLLKAEKNNKDRKTLKEWLDTKIDDQDEWEKDKKKAEKAENKRKKKKEKNKRKEAKKKAKADKRRNKTSMWKQPKSVFLIGLIIGLALGGSAIYTSSLQASGSSMTDQQIRDQVDTYFDEQLGDLVPANITVAEVDRETYDDLYVVTMDVATENQTAERDVYLSKQSGLLFINSLFGGIPPIDAEAGQPIGGTQVPAGQQ